jgi:cytochrome c5
MSNDDGIASYFPPTLVRILVAAVPIGVVCYFAMGLHDKPAEPGTMTAAAVSERLRPVAQVVMASMPASAAASTGAASTGGSAAPSALQTGQAVYESVCSTCHGQGIAGAPRFGDHKAWGARIAQGYAVLVKHAIEGYTGKAGVMPPKGGSSLEDVEVARGVAYMADKAGANFPEPTTLAKN